MIHCMEVIVFTSSLLSLLFNPVADAGQLSGQTKDYIAKIIKYFEENKGKFQDF